MHVRVIARQSSDIFWDTVYKYQFIRCYPDACISWLIVDFYTSFNESISKWFPCVFGNLGMYKKYCCYWCCGFCLCVVLCVSDMFGQLLSTCGRSLAVVRLGLGQIKPNIYVPAYRLSALPLSRLYFCRQFYSVLSVNSQLHYPSCRTVGHLVFWRAYANDTRRHRSSVRYLTALFIVMIGAAYAGVPLYRMICQVSISVNRVFYALYTHMLKCSNSDFRKYRELMSLARLETRNFFLILSTWEMSFSNSDNSKARQCWAHLNVNATW